MPVRLKKSHPSEGMRFRIIIAAAIVAGVVVRLIGLPGGGTFADLILVCSWGKVVTLFGWTESYRHVIEGYAPTNYPPVNMAIFGAVTLVHDAIFGAGALNAPSLNVMMKLPSVFADAWMSVFLFAVLKHFIPTRTAVIAGIVCWLYPSYWLLSAYWGQTDSIFMSLSFGSLTACLLGFPFFAGVLLALSILTKVQGVIIAPVIFVLLARRPRTLLPAVLGGLIPCALVLTRFALADRMSDVLSIYRDIPGLPTYLNFHSYNFWWAIYSVYAPHIPDTSLIAGIISFRAVGYVLTSACYVAILWRFIMVLRKNPNQRRVVEASLAAAALCSLVFYMLMTRMHQRYFFPFVPCVLALWYLRPEGHRHVFTLSVTFCINLVLMMTVWQSMDLYHGAVGVVLAWINVLVVADLAAVWWGTVLRPGKSVGTV